ncbi:2-oxoglutarate and iron-dependent oxygenase JMJD4 [Patella vulgata]|uniref:2-oxoglutarate and iron-dependent oxygenase JMJD4 n=1 Tax=Patella vulgata TaxID=6465 RepID=UPI0024A960A9|nr:2-oxoglutarate and iron-dependent oxygenase JMJD4 [Patella vulgata]
MMASLSIEIPSITSSEVDEVCPGPNLEFPRLEEMPSYEEFFTNYLLPNRPCIFGSAVTSKWQSRKDWVSSVDGSPHLEFFKENFGDITVPVADCGKEEFSSHPKEDMTLSEYVDYLVQYKQDGYPEHERCLYLKDWHFIRDCPDYHAYTTPVYFSSDWLNEFWDIRERIHDDYRFVYIGPKGSWTPFHADVFRSYSWSANICGRKKWIFFPPGEEENLKDKFGNLMYDVNANIDPSRYPKANQVHQKLEVIQESGEIIFVPSGWHHQVINLEDTISINHNWLNGCSVRRCWQFIKSSLVDVEREIDDCKDMENWHQQCQIILKASGGVDYTEFYKFMSTIARHRITAIENCIENTNTKQTVTDRTILPTCDTSANNDSTDTKQTDTVLPPNSANNCSTDLQSLDKNSSKNNQGFQILDLCKTAKPCENKVYDKRHWRYLNIHHGVFDLRRVKDILIDMSQDFNFQQICNKELNSDELLTEISCIIDKVT